MNGGDEARDVSTGSNPPLFQRALGNEAWSSLAAPLRRMHGLSAELAIIASGTATVERGPSTIAGLLADLVGFPRAAAAIPVSVLFEPCRDGERWTRTFGDRRFSSRLVPHARVGREDRADRCVVEHIGAFAFLLELAPGADRLRVVPRRAWFAGLPLPRRLLPTGDSYETADGEAVRFHIEVEIPGLGLLVRYRGRLDRFDSIE